MSPKVKILSDFKVDIKFLNAPQARKKIEQNSCQSGFSFRKIVFGKRFREDFSEKIPTWEVCISKIFAPAARAKQPPSPKLMLPVLI